MRPTPALPELLGHDPSAALSGMRITAASLDGGKFTFTVEMDFDADEYVKEFLQAFVATAYKP
jgi:hypothetical protein